MPLRQPRMPRHDAFAQAVSAGARAAPARSDVAAEPPMSSETLRAALGGAGAALEIGASTRPARPTPICSSAVASGLRGTTAAARRRATDGGARPARPHLAIDAGASLTFSLAWPLAAADLSGLSLAIGVAAAEAIVCAPSPGHRIALKWPNDLWLADATGAGSKLGGILVETTPVGSRRMAVVGIGVNVLEQQVADAATGVAWLGQIDSAATPHATLLRLVPALLAALALFEEQGFAAFAHRFATRDLLRGRPVRCVGNGSASIDGIACGVSATGELLVRTTRGIEAIGSGEVSVRLAEERRATTGESVIGAPC